MKKVLIFIGLKIAELVGLVIGFSLFCCWMYLVTISLDNLKAGVVKVNNIVILSFTGLFVLVVIVMGLIIVIRKNWELADKLSKKH